LTVKFVFLKKQPDFTLHVKSLNKSIKL